MMMQLTEEETELLKKYHAETDEEKKEKIMQEIERLHAKHIYQGPLCRD